jgi:UDP-N-acetylglucosamine 1-carboxyvinyltransferase
MDKIIVHGGRPLSGFVKISGSKNSALPILAATLLTREQCVIHSVPDLSDIHYMLQILSHLGAQVERASGTVTIQADTVQTTAPYEIVRKMRASVCVLGPLLGRHKEARVSLPGGCVIGDRPIDLHLKGFRALNAACRVEAGDVKVFADELRGSTMNLEGRQGPTVLGTDNVLMAATLAEGTTVIEGAAAEPEVVDLANFLIKMGAKIEGAGTRRITVEGVKELHGAEHAVIPDRIEAGTFLVAAALAGTEVTLRRVTAEHHHQGRGYGAPPAVDHRTLPGFSHRHAGANVRVAEPRQRREPGHGNRLSAALHARFRAQTHGRRDRLGRCHGSDYWSGATEWSACDGK